MTNRENIREQNLKSECSRFEAKFNYITNCVICLISPAKFHFDKLNIIAATCQCLGRGFNGSSKQVTFSGCQYIYNQMKKQKSLLFLKQGEGCGSIVSTTEYQWQQITNSFSKYCTAISCCMICGYDTLFLLIKQVVLHALQQVPTAPATLEVKPGESHGFSSPKPVWVNDDI